MTLEMGKPIGAARAEAAKCATACRYYAEHGGAAAGRRAGGSAASGRSFIRYQPLGPVLAVMPWNFPVLAGVPLRGAGADGGQRRAAQARVERAAVRAGDRGRHPARRVSRRRLPDAADRLATGRTRVLDDPRVEGGDADRQRGGGRQVAARRRAGSSRRRCWSSAAATRSS